MSQLNLLLEVFSYIAVAVENKESVTPVHHVTITTQPLDWGGARAGFGQNEIFCGYCVPKKWTKMACFLKKMHRHKSYLLKNKRLQRLNSILE